MRRELSALPIAITWSTFTFSFSLNVMLCAVPVDVQHVLIYQYCKCYCNSKLSAPICVYILGFELSHILFYRFLRWTSMETLIYPDSDKLYQKLLKNRIITYSSLPSMTVLASGVALGVAVAAYSSIAKEGLV